MRRGPSLRVARGVLAGLFLIAAFLQYNDPDPWRWIAAYGLAAVASLTAGRAGSRALAIAVGIVCLAWALWLATGLPRVGLGALFASMKAEEPGVELLRELIGLALIVLWMAVLAWRRPRR